MPPRPSTFWYAISGVFFYLFSSLKTLRNTIFLRFFARICIRTPDFFRFEMDVLGLKTYDTVVELEWETFHERELKSWWTSFSSKDWAYIK